MDRTAQSSGRLKQVRLQVPVSTKALEGLAIGTVVYLDGVLFTAREKLFERFLIEGIEPPTDLRAVSNVSFHCSPAATVQPDGTYKVGALSATASFRFSRYMARWFEATGGKIVIGKAGMPEENYRKHFVPNSAVYLTTVGYGTGALLGRGIKRVIDVLWLEDFGIAQAVWILEVENFGPFLVESDLEGNSLFAQANTVIDSRVDEVYAGLRSPILKRYGETTSRNDEVV